MITILFFSITIFAISFYFKSNKIDLKNNDEETWMRALAQSILIALFFTPLLSMPIAFSLPADTLEIKQTNELISIQDEPSFNCVFFIFFNSVKYTYYVKTRTGQYETKEVDCNDVTINYIDSDSDPYVETIDHVYTDDWINLFARDRMKSKKIIFNIPIGSIKNKI